MSLQVYILSAQETQSASIAITNTNQDGEPVSGVKIELYDSDDELIQVQVSDSRGNVEFSDISIGSYKVNIVSVPLIYQNFSSEYSINVTNDNQNYVANNQLFYKSYNTITVHKTDIDGNPLAGSELTIYDENQNPVEVIVTDENGFAESNKLENGVYYVKETKAPVGYELDPNIYTIYVGSEVANVEYTSVSAPLTTEKNIEILDESGTVISGVQFNLLNPDGKVTQLESNKKGFLSVDQLSVGDYTLRLVDSTFTTDVQEYCFTVSNDGSITGLPSQIYLSTVFVEGGVLPVLAKTGTQNYMLLIISAIAGLMVAKKVNIKG